MTKKHVVKKESDTYRLVNDDLEIQSSQLKFSIEDGSISLRPDYGVIDIKDGTLVIPASAALVSTEDSFLKSGQAEGIFTIKDGSLTIPSPSASVLVENSITVGDLTGKEAFTVVESANKSLLLESGILQSGVEDALLVKDGAFIMPSAIDPLLAEGVILKTGTEEVFSIKEGVFTVESKIDPLGMETDSSQVGTEGVFITDHEASSVVVKDASLLSQSDVLQPSMGDMFKIRDGAFIVAARTEQSDVLQSHTLQNTLTIKDGSLVYSPTDRLLMGENAFLEINLQQGTLIIKEDAFKLATEYAGNVHLMGETQKVLSSIEWPHIGDGLRVDVLERTRIQDSFLKLSDSYSGLFIGAEGVQPGFCSLPPSIVGFPPDEYFRSASLLAQVTHPGLTTDYFIDGITKEEPQPGVDSTLLTQLQEMDVGFGTMLQGAVQALRSDHSDKVRHFSISLRELFTHVLHRLSPDDAVKKWSTSSDDFYKGKPIRKARLKYIYREIDEASFKKFVEDDIKNLLEFLNLFHGATHCVRPTYTDSQLRGMLVRMENTLRFLIEVSRA